MNGYIEPCGCAGLENQKGGLSRRHTFLEQLRHDSWDLAPVDLGGLVGRFGKEAEIKFHTIVDALKTQGYRAVAFGPEDLRLPAGEVYSDAANEGSAFVSANAAFVFDAETVPRFRVIEAAGVKLGVTAIVGDEFRAKVNNVDLEFKPAAEALAEVLPELEKKCDLLILMSHATREESLALAKRFRTFDVVVTAGGADEPPLEPTLVAGTNAWLIDIGHKGMYLGVIGIFNDKKHPLRYQLVPLDSRFKDSVAMRDAMRGFQDQLQAAGFDGLGLRPVPHPQGEFVGSQRCGECHTKAYAVWEKTPHAHATETLSKLDVPRHFDPECLSCHVTGWDAQRFSPYASGFTGLESSPLLSGNGCENCHGPGAAHVAAETGDNKAAEDELTSLRHAMRLPLADAEKTCFQCHDLDNSPEFQKDGGFQEYWSKVVHRGKD